MNLSLNRIEIFYLVPLLRLAHWVCPPWCLYFQNNLVLCLWFVAVIYAWVQWSIGFTQSRIWKLPILRVCIFVVLLFKLADICCFGTLQRLLIKPTSVMVLKLCSSCHKVGLSFYLLTCRLILCINKYLWNQKQTSYSDYPAKQLSDRNTWSNLNLGILQTASSYERFSFIV